MEKPYLQMKGITKRFRGVLALDNVDFSVNLGEIVGLLGENGAGKSTLIKTLAGIYEQDDDDMVDISVGQNFYNMGYLGVQSLYKVINGEQVPEFLNTGVLRVSPDNYKQYVN